MSGQRQRGFRKGSVDYTGYEFENGVVLSEHSVGVWNVECKHCGKIHKQNTRSVRNGSRAKECELWRSWNWSGNTRRENQVIKDYGVTLQEIEELAEFQDGKCGICGCDIDLEKRNTHIDHDHDTGEVRGILCNSCNTGIGHLGDNIEGLKNALYYLENQPYKEFKYSTAR